MRQILSQEMGLKVNRQRFEYQGSLYPINPVVFEHTKMLGYFQTHAYQIGINRNLIGRASHEFLKNLIRHELCHYYLHITQQAQSAHGPEFRDQCKKFGWGEEVYSATTSNESEALLEGASSQEEAKILSKVRKLLSLAKSTNRHEAEMATAKANQLIMEHNLQVSNQSNQSNQDEELAYVAQVMHSKRNNQKLKSIYEILKLFMVQPIFSYSQNSIYLEVVGDKIHVEMADYIAKFLDNEMENLWLIAKKENPELKGTRSKNSFFDGLAVGFCNQILQQRIQAKITPKSLISLEKKLEYKVELAFPRLSSTSGHVPKRCEKSKSIGQKLGAAMNIRKGINQSLRGKLLS